MKADPMVLAIVVILVGASACVHGVRMLSSRRPMDLLGAVVSAGGLATAMLGVARLLSGRFFPG